MEIVLDSNNVIIELEESWNDSLIVPSRSLIDSEIVGKSYLGFISGDATRMAVDSALMYTRATNAPLKKFYRCDSTDVNRFCEMELTPLNNYVVKIEHSILRLEDKPSAPLALNRKDMKEYLFEKSIRCSMCCRYLWDDSWLEIEDFSVISKKSAIQLFHDPVDYTLCGSCLNDWDKSYKVT